MIDAPQQVSASGWPGSYIHQNRLTQLDLSTSIDAYERVVHESIAKAKGVRLPDPVTTLTFSTTGLSEGCLSEGMIKQTSEFVPTGGRKEDQDAEYIYVFLISPSNAISAKDIHSVFKEFQESVAYKDKGKKDLCKLNELSSKSSTLYVGRSSSPRERFKSHLRSNTSGTYSIHFAAWASAIDLKIEFYLYKFSAVENRVIQILEDCLWDHLKPMLGRRGEK